jgi:phenylacetate-CoA ligase
VARASSPWHRDRIAGVDPDGFEEADLAGLPPMTKDDLMANWDRVVAPELAAQPMRVAMVGARIATHMTSAMPQTFANPMVDVALFPVTQPIDRIVAGLNAYQPLALMGYPSMLALLAAEARAGRLRILPRRVTTTSEPLLPEVRRALTEAFCAPVANMYGTSEAGPIGVGCFRRPGIHLCDDLAIVEPAARSRPGSAPTSST